MRHRGPAGARAVRLSPFAEARGVGDTPFGHDLAIGDLADGEKQDVACAVRMIREATRSPSAI
jgi:hypothetical protein